MSKINNRELEELINEEEECHVSDGFARDFCEGCNLCERWAHQINDCEVIEDAYQKMMRQKDN